MSSPNTNYLQRIIQEAIKDPAQRSMIEAELNANPSSASSNPATDALTKLSNSMGAKTNSNSIVSPQGGQALGSVIGQAIKKIRTGNAPPGADPSAARTRSVIGTGNVVGPSTATDSATGGITSNEEPQLMRPAKDTAAEAAGNPPVALLDAPLAPGMNDDDSIFAAAKGGLKPKSRGVIIRRPLGGGPKPNAIPVFSTTIVLAHKPPKGKGMKAKSKAEEKPPEKKACGGSMKPEKKSFGGRATPRRPEAVAPKRGPNAQGYFSKGGRVRGGGCEQRGDRFTGIF